MKNTESKTTNPNRAAAQPHFSTQGTQHSEAEANFFSPIQAKLEMGQPNDRFEQEADSVADKVVQRLQDPNLEQETIENSASASETAVQTELAPEQEEEKPVQLEEQTNAVESVVPEQTTDVQASTQTTAPLIQKQEPVSEEEATEEETPIARKEQENSSAEAEPIIQTKIETKDQNNLGNNNSDNKTITPTSAPKLQTVPEIKEEEPIEEEQTLQKKAKETTAAAPPAEEEEQPPIQPKTDTSTSSSISLPSFESQLSSSRGGGNPLPNPVQRQMGTAFKTDFSPVRIHTDSSAVQMSRGIGARAFTHGADIYFNQGEYNPGSKTGQHLLAHELTHTLQQGATLQRKLIQAQTAPDIQASLVQDALSALGNIADRVPGYRLFSVLVQHDLIRNTHVEFNAENLVDGLMSLIPFGHDIFLQLQQRGIIRDAFDWINANLQAHDLTGSRFRRIWDSIIDIPLSETFSPIEFANSQLRPLLNDAMNFARAAVDELMRLIKEALKGALREVLAENQAYLLITKILHHDPVMDETVNASTVEILEDFLRLIGKETELEQMRAKGTLQETADWIDGQLNVFMSLLQDFQGILSDAWAAIQPENLPNIAENLQGIATRFGDFLSGVWDFATTVAAQVLQFIKDALLSLLREHASSIRGYRLFTVILGKDPVTEQPVERNARNIIAGFVELVAGIEQYQQMEQTGAIDEMAAWVDGLIRRYGISVEFVRDLFLGIWDSLTIDDLVHPIDAFERIVNEFREPIIRLLSFALEVIKKLIEVLLRVMNFPSEVIGQIIERATQAMEDIQRDPVGFLLNLLRALKQGFAQFFDNIGTHLVNGLVGWLTSELQEAGIQPPRDLSLQSIIAFVLDVLGISMERIWQKLAEHPQIGPERVARVREFISRASDVATGVWAFIQDVQREGIGAIWRHIQEQLSNLWDTVLGAIQSWITERIVNQMVTRLLSMLDPTGIMAVINSFIAFYRAVQSFIEKLRQILEVINSFVGGIAEIARGTLTTAANFLERTLASSLPVIIGFLANQVGLRGLGTRIGEMIERVRALVDQALTWLVNRAVQGGMSLFNRLMGRTEEDRNGNPAIELVINDIHQAENQYLSEGKINQNEAQLVASTVARRHSNIVTSITVVDGINKWNYNYVQRSIVEGKPKEEDGGHRLPEGLTIGMFIYYEREFEITRQQRTTDDPIFLNQFFSGKHNVYRILNIDEELNRVNLVAEDGYVKAPQSVEQFTSDYQNGEIKIFHFSSSVPIMPAKQITFNIDSSRFNLAEYRQQLRLQERSINAMTIQYWIQNKERFDREYESMGIEGGRDERDPAARENYRNEARRDFIESQTQRYINQGIGQVEARNRAETEVEGYMSNTAATHGPDGVAGGHFRGLHGLGDSRINSSIGSQWGHGRSNDLKNAVLNFMDTSSFKDAAEHDKRAGRMNVNLT